MTDWASLRDAYGEASPVPDLLQRLSTDDTDPVWHELWSRICHQGTVYSASFAALPRLLEWSQGIAPAQRTMVLMLAAAIVRSRDVSSGLESRAAAVESTCGAFHDLAVEAMNQPGLAEGDFIHVVQAVLSFRGEQLWGTVLDQLNSGEFAGVCIQCQADLNLVIGRYGFFTSVDEWVNRPNCKRTPIESAALSRLAGVSKWLHDQAIRCNQQQVAAWIPYIFGTTRCPSCNSSLEVSEAIKNANGG